METVQLDLKKKQTSSSSTQGQDLRGAKNSGVVVESNHAWYIKSSQYPALFLKHQLNS